MHDIAQNYYFPPAMRLPSPLRPPPTALLRFFRIPPPTFVTLPATFDILPLAACPAFDILPLAACPAFDILPLVCLPCL